MIVMPRGMTDDEKRVYRESYGERGYTAFFVLRTAPTSIFGSTIYLEWPSAVQGKLRDSTFFTSRKKAKQAKYQLCGKPGFRTTKVIIDEVMVDGNEVDSIKIQGR